MSFSVPTVSNLVSHNLDYINPFIINSESSFSTVALSEISASTVSTASLATSTASLFAVSEIGEVISTVLAPEIVLPFLLVGSGIAAVVSSWQKDKTNKAEMPLKQLPKGVSLEGGVPFVQLPWLLAPQSGLSRRRTRQ